MYSLLGLRLHTTQTQVEFPCGRRTLCLIPARFHKKLWIKNGNFLIVEEVEAIDAAVSGQIVKVLYADHVKQLQRIPGVWCVGRIWSCFECACASISTHSG